MDDKITSLIIRRTEILTEMCMIEQKLNEEFGFTRNYALEAELDALRTLYRTVDDKILRMMKIKRKQSFWKKLFRK